MNPSSLEISLSLKPTYVPKSLSSLLFELSRIDNEYYKLSVLSDYIRKHEDELTRVEALKHELPQSYLLLMEAIEKLKEEFLNIKKNLQTKREIQEIRCSATEEDCVNKQKTLNNSDMYETLSLKGSNLKEIQQPCNQERSMEGLLLACKESGWVDSLGSSSSGKEKEAAAIVESSRNYNQGFLYLIKKEDEGLYNYDGPKPLTQSIWKNNRICWSSELHSRFLEALNMVGGIEG
ncbi:transcription factor HHO6-like isoform X2 [Hibiscus syriacus]|uniref:transcription factor HHO6-like isoform X2 n=1 Tax=Hibiscus syriacus TaxID=106335 RepID=UPI001923E7B4|nr:transcription factor HHO6-like isoform X2 [Hibiscus syriacus]XP_039027356.1 transcription factor HHO6-like isoform X2 [Hibiscus syriacus]